MLGAYDTKPSSGKIILMGLNKKLLFHPPGGKNFVHVRDVAKGLISCLEKGKNGERFVLEKRAEGDPVYQDLKPGRATITGLVPKGEADERGTYRLQLLSVSS